MENFERSPLIERNLEISDIQQSPNKPNKNINEFQSIQTNYWGDLIYYQFEDLSEMLIRIEECLTQNIGFIQELTHSFRESVCDEKTGSIEIYKVNKFNQKKFDMIYFSQIQDVTIIYGVQEEFHKIKFDQIVFMKTRNKDQSQSGHMLVYNQKGFQKLLNKLQQLGKNIQSQQAVVLKSKKRASIHQPINFRQPSDDDEYDDESVDEEILNEYQQELLIKQRQEEFEKQEQEKLKLLKIKEFELQKLKEEENHLIQELDDYKNEIILKDAGLLMVKRLLHQKEMREKGFERLKSKFTEASNNLKKGFILLKYGLNDFFFPQERILIFTQNLQEFYWISKKIRNEKRYLVSDIIEIRRGRKTDNFMRFDKTSDQEQLSFSLILKQRTIDLEAKNMQQKVQFLQNLQLIIDFKNQSKLDPIVIKPVDKKNSFSRRNTYQINI